jgi:alpha-1,6-mannosyltransferase
MLFNVVHGHAAEWGVMPRTYYLGALAKLLLGAFPLANLALMWAALQGLGTTAAPFDDKHLARTVRELVRVFGPSTTTLIAGLSGIGHKEWRFIVYAVPLLNLVAAAGAAALWALPHSGKRLVARFAVVGALLGTAAFTAFSTYVSSKNYPGGEVWRVLETLDIPAGSTIHFPSYPLQTGASLFTFTHERYSPTLGFPRQQEPNWVYSKDEDPALLLPEGAAGAAIDYVVTPDWENFAASGLWKEVASIDAYAGIRRGGKYFVEAVSDKKLAVLRRADLA